MKGRRAEDAAVEPQPEIASEVLPATAEETVIELFDDSRSIVYDGPYPEISIDGIGAVTRGQIIVVGSELAEQLVARKGFVAAQ